jgi:hypothetical protein
MSRFLVVFVVLLTLSFGVELTPWAQEWFVTRWTNPVARTLGALMRLFDESDQLQHFALPWSQPFQRGLFLVEPVNYRRTACSGEVDECGNRRSRETPRALTGESGHQTPIDLLPDTFELIGADHWSGGRARRTQARTRGKVGVQRGCQKRQTGG